MLFFFYLAIASGCQTEEDRCVDHGCKLLNAAEIRQTIRGNTMTGTIPAFNTKFHVYYNTDGRMSGTAMSGAGTDFDKGTYVVKESGELCMRWNKWQGSGCAPVYRDKGEYKIFNPSTGVLFVRQRMRKGNVEKLEP